MTFDRYKSDFLQLLLPARTFDAGWISPALKRAGRPRTEPRANGC